MDNEEEDGKHCWMPINETLNKREKVNKKKINKKKKKKEKYNA